jgi:hypothetical protein
MSFHNRFAPARTPRSQSHAGRQALRRRMCRPLLEPLEDWTLLTSAWQDLAAALNQATDPLTSVLGAAETGLNSLSSEVSSVASSLPFFNGASSVGTLVTNGLSNIGR